MSVSRLCPECGAVPPANAPGGLCPRCLFARAVPDAPGAPSVEALRAEFAGYEVGVLIGRGGMGTVYRARQRSLDRDVALKLLPLSLLEDEEFLDRFQREGLLMARLDHPNIARVFDANITDSGQPYLVIELIAGEPITAFTKARALGLRPRLDLFQQVCEAVQHAHQKGIIHRDLKPSNILVTEQNGRPLAKVIDFGLARPATDARADEAMWLSGTHAVGTPAYMSPEQAAGAEVDTRSDVYSLGMLLYELLTGTTPFDEAQLRGAPGAEVARILRDTPTPKPSECLAGQDSSLSRSMGLHPVRGDSDKAAHEAMGRRPATSKGLAIYPTRPRDLRGDLDAIILKSLAKNPADRYATVAALAEDISHHLHREPVSAVRATPAYLAGRFLRRHLVALATVTLIAMALIAGLVLSLLQTTRAQRAEEVARRRAYYTRLGVVMRDLKEGRGGRFQELLSQPDFIAAAKDFPGWEWPFLHSLADRSLVAWPTHVGGVTALAAARDGQRLASVGPDGRLKVWSLATNAQSADFPLPHPPRTLTWHPEAPHLGLATSNGRLMIWDETECRMIADWQAHSGAINTLDWSPDGTRLASGGEDGQLIIWDAKAQSELARFVQTVPVLAASWAPDNDRIAAASGPAPAVIQIWSLSSSALTGSLKDPFEGVLPAIALAWNPDGRRIAVGTAHWYVKVFDVETGKIAYEHRMHRGPVRSVSWSSNGEKLATASDDGTIRVQHFDLRRHYFFLAGHRGPVPSVAWIAQDGFLASGGQDGTVRLWPAIDLGGVVTHARLSGWLSTLAFDPQGRRLAMAWGNNALEVWDTDTEIRLHRLTGHAAPLRSVAWSPTGEWIAGGDHEGKIHLWDAATGEARRTISGLRPIALVLWSPTGQKLLALEEKASEAVLVNSSSGERILTLQAAPISSTITPTTKPRPSVLSAAWAPEGRRLALGDETGRLVVFEANDGQIAADWRAVPTAICAMSWGADSDVVAVGAEDGILRALSPFDEQTVWTTTAHRGRISLVAWHPDGRRIATAGDDGLVKLFDAATGDEVVEVAQHYNHITGLAWSANGTKLATGSHDFNVWILSAAFGTAPNSSQNVDAAELLATELTRRDHEIGLLLRQPWVSGGEYFDQAEWLPRALEHVERQIRIDPKAAFLQAQRAWLLFRLGRLEEAGQTATACLTQPAVLKGEQLAGQLARGVLVESLRRRGRADQAAAALGIPARALEAPAQLLDLTQFYNASLDDSLQETTPFTQNNLSHLPRGLQTLAGIPFDVRGVVRLTPSGDLGQRGVEVHHGRFEGIRVDQTARRLHFLHAAIHWTEAFAAHVATYVVRYRDGQAVEIPIHAGRDLDCWQIPEAKLKAVEEIPRIAWTDRNPASHAGNMANVLYLTTWENPRPGAPIATLDLVINQPNNASAPFVVAVTAEP